MGEAKVRKSRDVYYGVPKRGLIISPPTVIEGTSMRIVNSDLDPQELRFSLLFWDRLIWPSSRAVFIPSGPDGLFLESAGVLTRPDYTYNGDIAQGMARGFTQAFADINAKEPGQWAMSHGERSMILAGQNTKQFNGAQVDLHRAIPVPDRDVPLAEILEFKQKRGAELIAFRSEIDTLIMHLEASNDQDTELSAAVGRIDASCRDLLNVGGEWQYPVRLSNWKCSLELKPGEAIAGAMGAWTAASALGFGLTTTAIAALTGAAVPLRSAVKITAEPSWVGLRKTSPYLYVSKFHNEVF